MGRVSFQKVLWSVAGAMLLMGAAPATPAGKPTEACAPPPAELKGPVKDALNKIKAMPDSAWEEAYKEVKKREADGHGHSHGSPVPGPPKGEEAYSAAVAKLMAARPEELFAFATYKGEVPQENLGERNKLGDASVRLGSLTLKEPVDQVHATYRSSLEAMGHRVAGDQLAENSGYLAFRDTDGFMRTVTLVGTGEVTMVLVAVGDPARVQKEGNTFLADFPMPDMEGRPMDLRQEDGNQIHLTRQVLLKSPSPEAVMSFYKVKLASLGWRHDTSPVNREELRSASYRRGADTCSLTAMPGPSTNTVAFSAVCLTRR